MMNSFSEYKAFLTKAFKKSSQLKLLEFGLRVCESLNTRFHNDLLADGFQKEAEVVTGSLTMLADYLSNKDSHATLELDLQLAELYKASYAITGNLDLSEVRYLGRHELFHALEFCFCYLVDWKSRHIVACAFCPIKVITLMLVKQGLNVSDPDFHSPHPLFQQELDFQIQAMKDLGIVIPK
jgi:hypothetical protein